MTSVNAPPKLDLSRVMTGAFVLPWRRRAEFAKALAVPALAIFAIKVGWWVAAERMTGAIAWAAWAGNAILWVLFAVACHRLVLLELRAGDIRVVPGWGRRETLFVMWVLAISVLVLAAWWLAIMVAGTLVANLLSINFFESYFRYFSWIAGAYVFARLALLLPAAAIDARATLDRAWRQTRGNGWRMLVVVGVLPWTFQLLTQLIEGETPGVATGFVTTALATLFLAVEVSALSLSYRELAGAQTSA